MRNTGNSGNNGNGGNTGNAGNGGNEIQKAVNSFLKEVSQKDFPNEAINWGDLSCSEVVVGDRVVEITISEAAPDCRDLIEYIEDKMDEYLQGIGRHDWWILVKTEW